MPLSSARTSGGFLYLELDPHAGVAEHVDQGVEAELVNLAAQQIVEPRLPDAERTRGRALGHLALAVDVLDPHHQLSAQLQVLSLGFGEPDIEEHIAAAARDLQLFGQRCFLSFIIAR